MSGINIIIAWSSGVAIMLLGNRITILYFYGVVLLCWLFYMLVGQICTVLSHASEDPKEALAYRNSEYESISIIYILRVRRSSSS